MDTKKLKLSLERSRAIELPQSNLWFTDLVGENRVIRVCFMGETKEDVESMADMFERTQQMEEALLEIIGTSDGYLNKRSIQNIKSIAKEGLK